MRNEAKFQRSSGISTKEFSQMYQKINGILPRVFMQQQSKELELQAIAELGKSRDGFT